MELDDVQEKILDVLHDGRATQAMLADELDYSSQHIYTNMKILLAAGYVTKVHETSALYELKNDPRD
jgi:DNA-binding Lrp family transcriptional regulator